jgi:hypothetical protein
LRKRQGAELERRKVDADVLLLAGVLLLYGQLQTRSGVGHVGVFVQLQHSPDVRIHQFNKRTGLQLRTQTPGQCKKQLFIQHTSPLAELRCPSRATWQGIKHHLSHPRGCHSNGGQQLRGITIFVHRWLERNAVRGLSCLVGGLAD